MTAKSKVSRAPERAGPNGAAEVTFGSLIRDTANALADLKAMEARRTLESAEDLLVLLRKVAASKRFEW